MSNYKDELNVLTANLVGQLLGGLTQAKEKVGSNKELKNIIDQISMVVLNTKDDFLWRIRHWDLNVAGSIQSIQKHINDLIQDKNIETEWSRSKLLEKLKWLLHDLQHAIENPPEARTKATITEVGESSNRSNQENEVSMDPKDTHKVYQENKIPMDLNFLNSWDPKMKSCLYSLILFPENTELKKRLVIYWWIGLGLTEPFTGDTSRTESCELFFSNLVDMGILIPKYKKHNKLAIDRCIIEPTIHKQLGDLIGSAIRAEGACQLYNGDNMKVLLNIHQGSLNSEEISKNQDLCVVQLGTWQCTETETEFIDRFERIKPKSPILVDETDFLSKLGENVTYLSLRGISGIEELHESIGKQENLMILDLNTCRQLEKLPQNPRSISKKKLIRWALPQASWFKNLIVLDISGCYLLDHRMPKWICEISNLEVLKGFVVGNVGNKNRSCRLRDLSKLNKLRKLSIRIANRGKVDLSVLQPLVRLLVLTIIWEGNKNYISTSSLPENIEKLDIRCYPESEASKLLNPAKLKNLKRLYIRGGNLTKIPCEDNWEVEILRLRFLKNLEYPTWEELKCKFKNLRCVECVECYRLMGFPKEGIIGGMELDKLFQRDDASEISNES